MSELTREIGQRLAAPFTDEEVDWKPQRLTKDKSKAQAVAFIDARTVMRRLDEVVPGLWSFDYEMLSPDGKFVKGKLTICGVTRCDAGQEDESDEKTLKAAVSDALKRAAVHFGVGRYLYHLPQQWVPVDQYGKFAQPPRLEPQSLKRALRLAGVEVESAGDRKAQASPTVTARVSSTAEQSPSFSGGTVGPPAGAPASAGDPTLGELQKLQESLARRWPGVGEVTENAVLQALRLAEAERKAKEAGAESAPPLGPLGDRKSWSGRQCGYLRGLVEKCRDVPGILTAAQARLAGEGETGAALGAAPEAKGNAYQRGA